MFTKSSVTIWNVLASTKAELCARLDDIVSAPWDLHFNLRKILQIIKVYINKYNSYMYKTDLQLYIF